jgi:hypothetical protein
MRRKLPATTLLALTLAFAVPDAAASDGLPSGANANAGGITNSALGVNYVVVPAGRGTVVGRIDKRTGRLAAAHYLKEHFDMPAVALDGTPGGLSAGGRTLVLIRPRAAFPQRRTTLAVIDGDNLQVRDTIRLRGDFSYDALSPDGRTLYLIQYTSRRDVTRYAVRAYDLQRARMIDGRIVDQREPDEDMSGYPITRATSAHGRWAYTLYDGNEHPFVHALDTVRRQAFCIDLDALEKADLFDMRLDLATDGQSLAVTRKGAPVALINTRTFRVTSPAAPRAAAARPEDGGGAPWALAAIGGAALLAGVGLFALRTARRRRVLANA